MRPVEILLFLVTLLAGLAIRFGAAGRSRWVMLAAFAPLSVAVVQWTVESPRWHLIPLYAAAAGVLLGAFLPRQPIARGLLAGSLLAAAAGALLAWMFPVFRLPLPQGPLPIGRTSLHAVDPRRVETHSAGRGHPREIMIHLWYPAVSATTPAAAYEPAGLPPFRLYSQLSFVKTHTHPGAVPSRPHPGWPLLLYSSSWHGDDYANTIEIEDLVSQGFVVAVIDHPYGSAMTRFPDGRSIPAEPSPFWDLSSDERLAASMRLLDAEIDVRAGDMVLALDHLSALNSAPQAAAPLPSLDLSRVGAFGFSFGGAVAAEACRRDARIRAGIDMGGSLFGPVAGDGVHCPFLFMDDGTNAPQKGPPQNAAKRRYKQLEERDQSIERFFLQRPASYQMTIAGTDHTNFSDTPLYCRLPLLTGAGPIRPLRAAQIVNAYSAAFFRAYLLGSAEPLLDGAGSSAFPEVKLIRGFLP